jgi:hypothetical protein
VALAVEWFPSGTDHCSGEVHLQISRNSIPLHVPALALSLGASAAHANRLDDAQLTANCTGYQVSVTAIMIPNVQTKAEYQIVATPVGPGTAQSVSGSVDLPVNTLPWGAPVSATKSGTWSSPLVGTYDITGTPSLVGATEVYFTTFLNQPIRVTCEAPPPPPSGEEGCTPGYWKQVHPRSWDRYSPSDSYAAVFDVTPTFSVTLLGALKLRGGEEAALARHAAAALLNAANSHVKYAFTEAEVIEIVQDAYASGNFADAKDLFEAENERGCPLSGKPDKDEPCSGKHRAWKWGTPFRFGWLFKRH